MIALSFIYLSILNFFVSKCVYGAYCSGNPDEGSNFTTKN